MSKKLKPILAYENVHAVLAFKAAIETTLPLLGEVVEKFNQLGLSPLQSCELKPLLENPAALVKSKSIEAVGDVPAYGPFAVNKAKLIDSLELPDTTLIAAAISALHNTQSGQGIGPDVFDYFMIHEGKLTVDEQAVNRRLEGERVYATTEDEQAIVESYNRFLDAYRTLDAEVKKQGRVPDGLRYFRPDVLAKQLDGGGIGFNPIVYHALTNPL